MRYRLCSAVLTDPTSRRVETMASFYEKARQQAMAHPRFRELEARLLSIGGDRVAPLPDKHLGLLLDRGRVFDPKGRKRLRGELHRCHTNAALLYAKHRALGHGGYEIVTGYGLYEDGRWRQHSWVWDGERVIETNTDPVLYFGVVLNPFEAFIFVFGEVLARLPGYEEVCRTDPEQPSPAVERQATA
jgi:hypothetical protein